MLSARDLHAEKAKLTSYTEMIGMLNALQANDLSDRGLHRLRVTSIGKSVLGKEIPCIEISDPDTAFESTRRLFIICRQHGNEPATTEAMLNLARKLVTGVDEETASLLSKVSFFIIPMVNPDGADKYTRRNANGIDLNRDWLNLSQPETKCVYNKILEVNPDILIDEHELSPGNRGTDYLETAGNACGASTYVADRSVFLQDIVGGILKTHDITVKRYKINDHNPARLAHRYFPIYKDMVTLLFETRQAGVRQYKLQYRMQLHTVGTLTVAKYLAGREEELVAKITEYNESRRWTQLASRSKPKILDSNTVKKR